MYLKKLLLYFITLLAIVVFISLHGWRTYQDYKDVHDAATMGLPSPFLEHVQFEHLRKQILSRPIYLDADSYYWVLYATETVKDGNWRIRHSKYDNVPYGREVHWHSGYLWFLIGLGELYSFFSGTGYIESIEFAAGWSNPIIIGLFAVFWAIILARRINPLIGGVFPALLLFLWSLQSRAMFANVDHHILHAMFFLSQFLSIIIGGAGFVQNTSQTEQNELSSCLLQPTSRTKAKKWFILAAVFGALGLWVGATQQAILIGCIGIGGCLASVFFGKKQTGKNTFTVEIAPELWRCWGRVGAVCAFFLFLLEYFPGHIGMRLEVNHPLYALAWFAGAEAIYRFILFSKKDLPFDEKKRHFYFLLLSLMGVFMLPAAILWGPESWHFIHDSTMRRMHDYIFEFKPFDLKSNLTSLRIFMLFGLLPLYCFCLGGWYLIKSGSAEIYHRSMLLVGAVPLLVVTFLFLFQNRWGSLLAICYIVITILVASIRLQRNAKKKYVNVWVAASLISLLLPGNYLLIQKTYNRDYAKRVNSERFKTLRNALLAREVAINLLDRTGEEDVRIMASTWYSPYLAFYGVGRGVGSLYWPNKEGMLDTVRFFSDLDDETAKEIVQTRGLNYVILDMEDVGLAERVTWALYGTKDKDALEKTLAFRLLQGPLQALSWLEFLPMYYYPRSQQSGTVICHIKTQDEMSLEQKK